MLISDEWRSLNAQLHRERADFGSKVVERRIAAAKDFAAKTGCRTVLDYGCGKGALLKFSGLRFEVTGYDPAIPEYASKPQPADMVVCWDTLEHIEPDCLDDVLSHIGALAQKAVHLVIGTRPDSTKLMPDGRNPHLIIEPAEWWLTRLRPFFPKMSGRFTPRELEINWRA